MMRLTITGDSSVDIREQLFQAATQLGGGMKDEVPQPRSNPQMNHADGVAAASETSQADEAAALQDVPSMASQSVAGEAPVRGRPKSAHLQAVADIEKASRTFGMQDAVNAISQILSKYGMDHARQVLAEFGVKKIGEMSPELYADFVMHCEKVIAG